MAKRILIVDDEPNIIRGLQFNLEQQEGYIVDAAYDGQAALELFDPELHDLILLDLMLPKIDGMEVCQQIRGISNVPIIMLTAKDDDMDKIMGLEYGADDYLTKPFNMLELKARIKNILRRAEVKPEPVVESLIKSHGLEVDLINRTVIAQGEEVILTTKEFDLLKLFITNKGQVFERDTLLDTVWRQKGDVRTVDVHIRRLREKIEENPARPQHILTQWGVGYYFANE